MPCMSGNQIDVAVAESSGSRTSTRSGKHGHSRTGLNDDVGVAGKDMLGFRTIKQSNGVVSSSETDEAKRERLLSQKQAEVEGIVERHDDLVREMFHMENFTMMLSFDPPEAKADNTAVFQEYKAKYDLIDHAGPVAGPSRQTRGRRNEQRHILATSSISAQPLPSKKRTPKSKSISGKDEILQTLQVVHNSQKGKGKEKQREIIHRADDVSTVVDMVPGVLESASAPVPSVTYDEDSSSTIILRRRSKRKATQTKELEAPLSTPEPTTLVLDPVDVPRTRRASSFIRKIRASTPPPLEAPELPRKRTRRHSPKRPQITLSADNPEESTEKSILGASLNAVNGHAPCPPEPPPIDSISVAGRLKRRREQNAETPTFVTPPHKIPKIWIRPPTDDKAPRSVLLPSNIPVTPSPVKFTVKKIKLIVRRPPPTISNPLQRPPEPKHGSSLNKFLDSYIAPEDMDVELEHLEQEAKEEAVIREQISQFHNEGRFIPGTEILFGTKPNDLPYVSPQRSSKDTWDAVIEAIIARGRARHRKPLGKQVAAQVASKVQAHFDGQEARRIRAKDQEERRLRNLAKSTMKAVIAEWKKAVHHIRNKQREEQEAEERRLGHAHLDAILDQSGQLLETQQGDLSKGGLYGSRSRSGSVGGLEADDESDDDDEDNDEENQDVEEDESELHDTRSLISSLAAEQEEEAEEDELLSRRGPSESQASSSRAMSSTSGSAVPDSDDEDPNISTNQLLGGNPIDLTGSSADLLDNNHDVDSEMIDAPSLPFASGEGIEQSLPFGSVNDLNEISGQQHDMQPGEPSDPTVENEGQGEGSNENDDEDILHVDNEPEIPEYLKPFAVAPVKWDLEAPITPPLLLRGTLRPYQQSGLEWLASLHTNRLNGILADEMGLGKTIQTISLLAHLACDRGIWGPHLIVVPTSVLLNWEMEFKKFLPGFKVLSYHGSTKRRKELRQGWNDKYSFNVCITSYNLASRDDHIFKRKAWYYMILDEAHMIKNFKSQRWNILLMFRSFRRLLLTGTPLQNNLTELWALLQFLMSGSHFANLKEFGDWFSNPLEKAIEMGNVLDDDTLQRVSKLHTVLRPYLLRRLKRDVEKELPSKFEHLTLCPLSKRQRFLYDEFMSRAQTRDALDSGVYQKIANILMQLRKVCNHPDLFEVRPIVTSFAMSRSAAADFEIKDLLIRRRFLHEENERVNLDVVGLQFINHQNVSLLTAVATRNLDATNFLPHRSLKLGKPPPYDTRTKNGFRKYTAYTDRVKKIARWSHIAYLNKIRCSRIPVYSSGQISVVQQLVKPIIPFTYLDTRHDYLENVDQVNKLVKSYAERADQCTDLIRHFAFVTPPVVAMDLPHLALSGYSRTIQSQPLDFDKLLHPVNVRLKIAFPDPWLLQYDCGKMQKLASLLREKKAGGHRILIFTQMTRVLDILEIFLNFHGYLYLRLDGATKIEDRQYITERFNADPRIFCFISSSRSGGVGINLTGADTVIFYDSDFNPQMDRQCEDRAHRIGQIRDVHIYRFVSQHTVEEAMLLKANQKRSLDDLVIQKGEFDWRSLFKAENENALTKALGDFEDDEDRLAAAVAAREEFSLVGADDDDFGEDPAAAATHRRNLAGPGHGGGMTMPRPRAADPEHGLEMDGEAGMEEDEEQGHSIAEYMVNFVEDDYDHFRDWRL